ncbi:TetR/AcrR family transcriptional regulator [Paracoccus aminophilus]|uniref:Transcriptional regulator, TetR family n=1 Tax=Paracoccus aminophilus JCM 7686 TaxID=1367847 RepID=S5Y6F1_PARAH|nr:TetR/AcrR family transcriptional regulator [Paracoccus aminophilus]AGT11200.1 transcriptional regulator, TetR family [Paracoccus aminophilus JCM 7686]
MDKAPPPSSTRDRLLQSAGALFYAQGIREISMDAIAEAAGVTKRTLYYHFRSKDDLIAAWLEMRDQPNLAAFQHWFAKAEGAVPEKIRAIFDHLARSARRRSWQGCGFLRASVELVNLPGHPAVVAGRLHKKRVEHWLETELAAVAGVEAPQLARQIILLLDGAFAVVLLHRDPAYFETAGEAAATLIRSTAHNRQGDARENR